MTNPKTVEELYRKFRNIKCEEDSVQFVEVLRSILKIAQNHYFYSHDYDYIDEVKVLSKNSSQNYTEEYDKIDSIIFSCRRHFGGRDLTVCSNLIKQYFLLALEPWDFPEFESVIPEDFFDEPDIKDIEAIGKPDILEESNIFEIIRAIKSNKKNPRETKLIDEVVDGLEKVQEEYKELGSSQVTHDEMNYVISDTIEKLCNFRSTWKASIFGRPFKFSESYDLDDLKTFIPLNVRKKSRNKLEPRNYLAIEMYKELYRRQKFNPEDEEPHKMRISKITKHLMECGVADLSDEKNIYQAIQKFRKPLIKRLLEMSSHEKKRP